MSTNTESSSASKPTPASNDTSRTDPDNVTNTDTLSTATGAKENTDDKQRDNHVGTSIPISIPSATPNATDGILSNTNKEEMGVDRSVDENSVTAADTGALPPPSTDNSSNDIQPNTDASGDNDVDNADVDAGDLKVESEGESSVSNSVLDKTAVAVGYNDSDLFGDVSDDENDTATGGNATTTAQVKSTDEIPSSVTHELDMASVENQLERGNAMERDLFGELSDDEVSVSGYGDVEERIDDMPIAAQQPSSAHAAIHAQIAAQEEREKKRREEEKKRKADEAKKKQEQEEQQDLKRKIAQAQARKEAIKPKATAPYMTYAIPPVTIFENTPNETPDNDIGNNKANDPKLSIIPLPNVIGIQANAFDRDTYQSVSQQRQHSSDDTTNDEKRSNKADGGSNKKRAPQLGVEGSSNLTADNVVRWRYVKVNGTNDDSKGVEKPLRESNTRLVTWSDGSKSLIIGDETFDVLENLYKSNDALEQYMFADVKYDKENKTMQAKKEKGKSKNRSRRGSRSDDSEDEEDYKDDDMDEENENADDEANNLKPSISLSAGTLHSTMNFRVTSIHSRTHMKLTQAASTHHKQVPKIKRSAVRIDPSAQKRIAVQLAKQEEAKQRRAAAQHERGAAGSRRRTLPLQPLTGEFLEEGEDEEDEQEEEAENDDEDASDSGLASDEPSRTTSRRSRKKRRSSSKHKKRRHRRERDEEEDDDDDDEEEEAALNEEAVEQEHDGDDVPVSKSKKSKRSKSKKRRTIESDEGDED